MSESEGVQLPSSSLVLSPQGTSGPIVLQVGEQRFHTSSDSLSRSDHLNAMISGHWDSGRQPDGSYFIDADPEVFKHILQYLRLGLYPLCYDKAKGHDFAMYASIHKLANYLIIPNLVEWLSQRQYLKAVTIQTSAQIMEDVNALGDLKDLSIETHYYPTWRTVKKYVCPREIYEHYNNPHGCGKACRKIQGDAEDRYHECPTLSTLILTKKTVFNQHVCMED
ncbi:MAG: hypothetical protein Q9209_001523 [Squamulea sp. 1 TL-2023]